MTTSSEEVQRLLANLASYSSQSHNAHNQTTSRETSSSVPSFSSSLPGLGSLAPEAYQAALSKPSTPSPASYQTPSTSLHPASSSLGQTIVGSRQNTASPASKPAIKLPVPDASSITDWPTAIRHVMQHLLPNPDFGTRIRHLITTQHQYEQDWFTKRSLITDRHASRDTSSAQLNNIFANLGIPVPAAKAAATATGRDTEAEQRELAEYDAKVYKQLLALVGDFDRQLRQLGVPFYAIRHELVILEEGRERDAFVGKVRRIDRGELRELQRRMLEWLEMSFPEDAS
ncbi:uncharacterized protein AB675_6779 [Cyphellophora attinorum]|uniref:Uncharacterized protein n=1 Tax=Cyphellophora attinorum TaxID=1664694 RepID=A0A0N1HE56_9EURO|nr:uncharacterized protein AB675_6779 [Phialophora attinorum]KPI43153.1 hypothetical protein AB675_6779 [Phialophora attinorum]